MTDEAEGLGELVYSQAVGGVYFLPPAIFGIVGRGGMLVTAEAMTEFFQKIYEHPRFQESHGVILFPNGATLDKRTRDFYARGVMRPATLYIGVTDNAALRMLGTIINIGMRRMLKTPFLVKASYQDAVVEMQRALGPAAGGRG